MRVAVRFALLIVLVLVSCAKETTRPVVQQQLGNNDTPSGAISRLVGAYEQKRSTEYAAMFTGDFDFEFSNATDPDLVNAYAGGWLKVDEAAAAAHLFHGYTPTGMPTAPAASSIDITLATTATSSDTTASLDPATHKMLATRVDGQIIIPPTGTATVPTTYLFANNYSVFYLVRGDAAAGLDSSQPADTAHWYIRRWTDLTQPAVSAQTLAAPKPAETSTWGKVKGLYR